MASQSKTIGKDLTQGPIFRSLFLFAIPMILTDVVQQLYSMADLAIIGKFVGSIGTVGVSTGSEISDLLTPIAMAIATAGQIYISQLSGAKDTRRMREAMGTMLTVIGVCSILATILPIIFYRPILNMLNCPEEAFSQAAGYMIICSLGMPFVFGYNAISAMLRAIGESKRPLLFVGISAVINIFLDILLVAVIPLEAVGTAIATVASQIGACIAAFYFLYKHRDALNLEFKREFFRVRWEHLSVILKLGVPQLVRAFATRGSMVWVKAGINSYGLVYSATYAVGNKLEKMMDVFCMGFTNAAAAMIGQNFGARNMERITKTQHAAMACAMTLGAVAALLFLTCPTILFRVFTSDEEVISYGILYCRVMAVGILIHCLSSSYKCVVNGTGDVTLNFLVGILDGVGRILGCLLTVYVLHQGVFGYYWGAALCHVLPFLAAFLYTVSGKWKTKKLLTEQ